MLTEEKEEVVTKVPENESFVKRLYRSDFNINFVGKRKIWFAFSAVLILICFASFLFRGFNWGIEFKGGSVFQAPTTVTNQTVGDFSNAVANSGVSELGSQVSTLSGSGVRVQTRSLSTEEVVQVREAIANQAGCEADDVAYTLIGPSWGQQITNQALGALGVFIVLVFGLIWIYFRDWRTSLGAIVSLIHDVILTMGVFSLFGFTITPSTLIGVLTILGYSLYATVIVYDKVAENTKGILKQDRTYSEQTNLAVNQVLTRSINTTIIVVLPVVALLIAGLVVLNGEGPLADLGLSLFVGLVAGAYSSLFIAAPITCMLRERDPEIAKHTKKVLRDREAASNKAARNEEKPDKKQVKFSEPAASGPAGYALSEDTLENVERSEGASGRPQPARRPRSERKKH